MCLSGQTLLQLCGLLTIAERAKLHAVDGAVGGDLTRNAKLLAQLLLPTLRTLGITQGTYLNDIATAGTGCSCAGRNRGCSWRADDRLGF
ncbi:hypothetical protein D3C76_1560380 [compost metagenome]